MDSWIWFNIFLQASGPLFIQVATFAACGSWSLRFGCRFRKLSTLAANCHQPSRGEPPTQCDPAACRVQTEFKGKQFFNLPPSRHLLLMIIWSIWLYDYMIIIIWLPDSYLIQLSFLFVLKQEIPLAQCKLLADAVVESSSLLEFSLAANETTPEMLSRQ